MKTASVIFTVLAVAACTKTGADKQLTPRSPTPKAHDAGQSLLRTDSNTALCLKSQPKGYGDRLGCRDAALFTPIAPVAFGLAEEGFLQATALPVFVQTETPATNPSLPVFSESRKRKLQETLLLLIRVLRNNLDAAIACAQKGSSTVFPGGAGYLRTGITEFLNGGEFASQKPWGSLLAIGASVTNDAQRITFEHRDVRQLKESHSSRLYYLGIHPERMADDREPAEWAERIFVALLPYWDGRRSRAPQDGQRPPLGGCLATLARKQSASSPATGSAPQFFHTK